MPGPGEPTGWRARAGRALRTTAAWILLLGSLALLVGAVEGSRGRRPKGDDVGSVLERIGWVADHLTPYDVDMPDRRWAVPVAALLAVACAYAATVRFMARAAVFPRLLATTTAVVATWVLVALGPSVVADEVNAAGDWVRFFLAVPAAVVTVKVGLLYRASTGFVHTPPVRPDLLRNQQEVLRGLEVPGDRSEHPPFQLKQITGRWGAGKSQVLCAVKHDCWAEPRSWLSWRSRPPAACVMVDIWKHDSEVDLHRAIVGEILGHPACLLPWGWLRYPLFASVMSYLRNADVTLPFGPAELATSVTLPRLSWQRPLERTVARLNRRQVRLVVVLDELDRASSLVAQAALSMVHRSLDQPGVTVVLVHVPEIVEPKVFNPLFTEIADLRSNATAAVLREVDRSIRAGDGSSAVWRARLKTALAEADPAQPSPLDGFARSAFTSMDGQVQARLVRELGEKFLRSHPLKLGRPQTEDVADMLGWADLRDALRRTGLLPTQTTENHGWRRVVLGPHPRTRDLPLPDPTRARITDVVADWRVRPLGAVGGGPLVAERRLPPIRPLKNRLEEVVLEMAKAAAAPLTEADLLLAVLVALETCQVEADGAVL